MSEPRILLFDLETAPLLAWTFGVWNVNIGMNQIKQQPRILCWSARWLDTKGKAVMFQSEYKEGTVPMLTALRDLLDEADYVVGYNSNRFDIPWITEQLVEHGIELPSPYKSIDLFRIIKKHLKFPIYKLDYSVMTLLGDRKVENRGMSLWIDCMEGDAKAKAKAWKDMERYAKKDTLLLGPLYNVLKPFITTVNQALFDGSEWACPHCGSESLQKRGYDFTASGKFQRYQCVDCGKWSKDPKRLETTGLRAIANN